MRHLSEPLRGQSLEAEACPQQGARHDSIGVCIARLHGDGCDRTSKICRVHECPTSCSQRLVGVADAASVIQAQRLQALGRHIDCAPELIPVAAVEVSLGRHGGADDLLSALLRRSHVHAKEHPRGEPSNGHARGDTTGVRMCDGTPGSRIVCHNLFIPEIPKSAGGTAHDAPVSSHAAPTLAPDGIRSDVGSHLDGKAPVR
mmetsp:Transcript_87609/g.247225  ORF Transcript_87609/g.247225 Transcript_87609/m.247225 type:complete len:202 (+) Transcript_87609:447-1052(+)